MVGGQKKKWEKPKIMIMDDMGIILECLYEVYGEERPQVYAGRAIQETMIFPFVKMLENQCEGITAVEIHEKMWEEFSKREGKDSFIDNAGKLLQMYK